MATIEHFAIAVPSMLLAPIRSATAAYRAVLTVLGQVWGKMKDVAEKVFNKMKGVSEFLSRRFQFMKGFFQKAFQFLKMMKFLSLFLVIVTAIRAAISYISRPIELVLMLVSGFFITVIYIIVWIFSVPPFIWLTYFVYWLAVGVTWTCVRTLVFLALFIFITLVIMVLAVINVITGGALNNLILCQNSPSSWFKTPNYHHNNKYERGLMCSKPCLPGYKPNTSGDYCQKTSFGTPSYCPQAEIMRLYTTHRTDLNYIYPNYPIIGNMKYLLKRPEQREELLRNHYTKKIDFLNKCEDKMEKYNHIPLNICSSLDIIEKNNINNIGPATIAKMRQVCGQAYCNAKQNYPFCNRQTAISTEEDSTFWIKLIENSIMIITFLYVLHMSVEYIGGINLYSKVLSKTKEVTQSIGK